MSVALQHPATPPHPPLTSLTTSTKQSAKHTKTQLKGDTKLLNALRDSIQKNKADENGWVNYAVFSSYLQKHHSDINPQNYGYDKFYEIIDRIDLFEGKKENSTIFIRQKPTQNNGVNSQYSKEKLLQDTNLINAIKDGITKTSVNGWANFTNFTQYLNVNYPNIKPKNYGYKKWQSLINKIDLFEIKKEDNVPFIREISNDKSTVANTKIHNQKLLDDITQIINENTTRTDEWVHIGYLGSQLKNKGYNPKDLGFKTFGLLLANAWGITHKKVGSGDYFTLADQSNIQPANKTKAIKPKYNLDLQSTHFYQILLRNKMVISHKIQQFLDGGQEIDINDFLNLIIKNIPKEMMLDDKSNHECFLMFIEYELIQFKLIYKDNKAIFAHEYTIKPH